MSGTRFCQRQVQQVLKRQFGGNNVSWKVVSVPKQKPGCVTFCDGNNPVSGPMQPNCRNWCPATTLGINLLGVVWSGSTPPGNSFNFFQFIWSTCMSTLFCQLEYCQTMRSKTTGWQKLSWQNRFVKCVVDTRPTLQKSYLTWHILPKLFAPYIQYKYMFS